jgi:hypothetical protein
MSFIGCIKRRESMAKPLDQLSDPEFKIAYDNFKKTEAQAEKEETANPGTGWNPVREKLKKAQEDFKQELRRRNGNK